MKKAIIRDGVCENVIKLPANWTGDGEGDWQPPEGTTLVDPDENAEPGSTYNGSTFTKISPTPPTYAELRNQPMRQEMIDDVLTEIGGYGTNDQKWELLGEQGMSVFQQRQEAVKARIPKP
jgi:hypothetical protein|tara:strand:+ start:113 stop:475 length:363 start_codon:yes stop_codon:yes gene_type:complete